ncbi:hypothetical protein [Streptomyces himalayensis]|jgi:hypothetical protein|uniref:C2H2-type domain-containing protein n=1 Tax=Streptomyces himalayensis subsp. himalayensis TaxID=2756131 RepID=A0A7W0DSX7_9ACTN|nr:hypothetical protein [Streptomyces himalayensis]MBA2949824.1 hypothetical protein [Streptomyces himalayensis subsp. himalayensis]
MSEIAGTGHHPTATPVIHESYSFACMRCGHGWEQSYVIEHHFDADGTEFMMYTVDGQRVPSPLTSPTCLNCGGHVVRIMRAGQVSSVLDMMRKHHVPQQPDPSEEGAQEKAAHKEHHWHLSDLLHAFHRKAG